MQGICFSRCGRKKTLHREQKRFPRDRTQNRDFGPYCAVAYFVFNRSALGSEHAFSESVVAQLDSLREKAVREEIALRLGKICSNFSADEFETLVAVMAARQVKCERRATPW